MKQAKVITMPTDAKARDERLLIAAWAKERDLEARLRKAKAESRALEKRVADARGYPFIRREALALAIEREPR